MKQDCYGYAMINNTLRLWDYNTATHTPNHLVSWSSQELEYLSTDKKSIFNFLDRPELPT